MAILYGTTGDGTTLPVLVDQFGNLLAKGIDGPEGPPGPPGIGQLPPDPFEGAILGWEGGELSWLGGSVPLPAGTYGPYTYIPDQERLDVPQDASGLVRGQQLFMSDFSGKEVSVNFTTDTIASVDALAYISHKDVTNWLNAFDGNNNTYALYANVGSTLTFSTSSASAQMIIGNDSSATSQTVGVYLPDGTSAGSFASTGKNTLSPGTGTTVTDTFTFSSASSSYILRQTAGSPQNIRVYSIESVTNTLTFPSATNFDKFEVGDVVQNSGEILAINAGATPPTMLIDGGAWLGADGSGDLNGQTDVTKSISGAGGVLLGVDGAIVLRENNEEWLDGYYVTAPEQRIAARKVATAAIRRKKN